MNQNSDWSSRLFAWLFNFRRLAIRYEYQPENFQGFVHLAAVIILLRHLCDTL
jgi:transposase